MTLKNKRILITCGPTWIPIDDTRILSNISTGSLGQIIARACADEKAKVTVLEGPVAQRLNFKSIKTIPFLYYNDFLYTLKKELKKSYEIVIHAAAVSDYRLEKPFKTKISSEKPELVLRLTPTQKIINLIKHINPHVFLVGFKLKSHLTLKKAVEKSRVLFEKAGCDLLIANSVAKGKYHGYILNPQGQNLARCTSRLQITRALVKELKKRKV